MPSDYPSSLFRVSSGEFMVDFRAMVDDGKYDRARGLKRARAFSRSLIHYRLRNHTRASASARVGGKRLVKSFDFPTPPNAKPRSFSISPVCEETLRLSQIFASNFYAIARIHNMRAIVIFLYTHKLKHGWMDR